jgi:hypothetical protein
MLQEEPEMKKRLRKSEKLDLILLELFKLKAEIKKLLKHRAVVADQCLKVKSSSTRARRPKNVPQRSSEGKEPAGDAVPSKPVQVPQGPQIASRVASQ